MKWLTTLMGLLLTCTLVVYVLLQERKSTPASDPFFGVSQALVDLAIPIPSASPTVSERTQEYWPHDRVEFLAAYPQFRASADNGVELRGSVVLRETIALPIGVQLSVAPGATVWMHPGVSLIVRGPVTMRGTQDRPIVFRPRYTHQPWGGVAVMHAASGSMLQWVEMRGGSASTFLGTPVEAMAAFIDSSVVIADAVFADAMGSSALMLSGVVVDIVRSAVRDALHTGLSIVHAPAGSIAHSIFSANAERGLHMMHAPVALSQVRIEGSGVCVHVEQSTPSVRQSTVQNCGVGLAVADVSHAAVEQSAFVGNGTAIFAAQEDSQPPSSVSVINTTFRDNLEDTLAEGASTIAVDESGF